MDPETVPSTTPDTPPADAAAEAMAALDTGIAAAAEGPSEPAAPATTTAAAKPAEGEPAPALDADGKPVVAPPLDDKSKVPGAEPTEAEKAAAAAEAAKAQAPEPDKAVEDEITALGLKEKSAERFRTLANEAKEGAQLRETLTKAGVTDLAQLPQMLERSKTADDMIAMVMDTGATSEQFGNTLDYMKLTNMALAGNKQAAEKAFELVGKEYAELAKALGREVPGVYDPLADHPDLLAEIESEDLTRARALEIVGQRNAEKLSGRAREISTTQEQQTKAAAKAIEDGKTSLAEFDAAMLAADPSYAPRRAQLSAAVAEIRKTFPPNQWAAQAALALAKIPVAAPVVAAKVPVGPMRPGPTPPVLAPTTDDPMEAMNQGIAAASN